MARFGTVAIDGTKVAANASIDANRGQAWFAEQAATMIVEAEHADVIDNARADQDENLDGDRIPPELVDRSHRTERIREAARQLAERHGRLDEADHVRDIAARARLARSQAGLPVVGCIPKGPHHWPKREHTWRASFAIIKPSSTSRHDRRFRQETDGSSARPDGAAPRGSSAHAESSPLRKSRAGRGCWRSSRCCGQASQAEEHAERRREHDRPGLADHADRARDFFRATTRKSRSAPIRSSSLSRWDSPPMTRPASCR
jgi:hypothetical protein